MGNAITGWTPATPEQIAQWALEDDSPVLEHDEQLEPDYE